MRYVKHTLSYYLTLFCLISAGVLIGCSEAPTAPLSEASLTENSGLSAVSAGKATIMTSNIRVPIANVPNPIPPIPVPCANGGAGELVVMDGTIHLVTHTTVNNAN